MNGQKVNKLIFHILWGLYLFVRITEREDKTWNLIH